MTAPRRETPTMDKSLEQRLIELAWRDPAFLARMESDPKGALAEIGVEVAPEVRIEIRMQRRDTLYFVIPPAVDQPPQSVINQMDLWESADVFSWIMPQHLKVELLRMRQSYRRNNR